MAQISSTLGDYYFSIEIPNWQINSTVSVTLTIKAVINGGKSADVVVFSTQYYPFNGKIIFRDLRSIVENYMLENKLAVQTFKFCYGTYTKACTIVFSRNRMDNIAPQLVISDHFLTTRDCVLIFNDMTESLLMFYPYPSDYATTSYAVNMIKQFKYRCVYRKEDGEVESVEKQKNGVVTYGLNNYQFSRSRFESVFSDKLPAGSQILYASVNIEGRTMAFYMIDQASVNTFQFRNNFNCLETVSIPSSTKQKTESDSSTAVCDGEVVPYDVEHKQTFEVQSGQLMRNFAIWINEMLTSNCIYWVNSGKAIRNINPSIIITDYTSEISDAPGAENTVEFTWQLVDQELMGNQIYNGQGIFSAPFTEQFA